MRPENLRCEYMVAPLGLDGRRPRLSWIPPFDQAAYQIKVTGRWDSGRVNSAESLLIEYAGKLLVAGKHYEWQVRVWDRSGKASAWSEPATHGKTPATSRTARHDRD